MKLVWTICLVLCSVQASADVYLDLSSEVIHRENVIGENTTLKVNLFGISLKHGYTCYTNTSNGVITVTLDSKKVTQYTHAYKTQIYFVADKAFGKASHAPLIITNTTEKEQKFKLTCKIRPKDYVLNIFRTANVANDAYIKANELKPAKIKLRHEENLDLKERTFSYEIEFYQNTSEDDKCKTQLLKDTMPLDATPSN